MKKKKNFYIGIVLIIIIAFLFCWLFFSKLMNKNSSIEFSYTQGVTNQLVLNNLLPINDSVGKTLKRTKEKDGVQSYFDFEVKNPSSFSNVKYEVYLVAKTGINQINPNYVKVYLTDEKENSLVKYSRESVPVYSELRISANDIEGKQVYVGSLKKQENKKFRLRIWLSDAYVVTPETREFSIGIRVKAIS